MEGVMGEAKITINNQELSEPQSRVVRLALIALLRELGDRRVAEALGSNMALDYHLRLTELICMIDETPVELGRTSDELVVKSLNLIAKLSSGKLREGR
jgi:hypothetical protein